MRTLIAIPAIDRDSKHFANFYSRLQPCLSNVTDEIDLLILTRDQDTEIQKCWSDIQRANVMTFENYQIEDRHNLAGLVIKRNTAIDYARNNGYDFLWFLDSDTGVHPDTLQKLKESIRQGADITVAPYIIREFGRPMIGIVTQKENEPVAEGIFDPHLIQTSDIHFPIALAPFGCTLIEKGSFTIHCNIRMISGHVNGMPQSFNAEDIGYFINAYHANKKVYCLSNYLVDHLD